MIKNLCEKYNILFKSVEINDLFFYLTKNEIEELVHCIITKSLVENIFVTDRFSTASQKAVEWLENAPLVFFSKNHDVFENQFSLFSHKSIIKTNPLIVLYSIFRKNPESFEINYIFFNLHNNSLNDNAIYILLDMIYLKNKSLFIENFANKEYILNHPNHFPFFIDYFLHDTKIEMLNYYIVNFNRAAISKIDITETETSVVYQRYHKTIYDMVEYIENTIDEIYNSKYSEGLILRNQFGEIKEIVTFLMNEKFNSILTKCLEYPEFSIQKKFFKYFNCIQGRKNIDSKIACSFFFEICAIYINDYWKPSSPKSIDYKDEELIDLILNQEKQKLHIISEEYLKVLFAYQEMKKSNGSDTLDKIIKSFEHNPENVEELIDCIPLV